MMWVYRVETLTVILIDDAGYLLFELHVVVWIPCLYGLSVL